MHNLKALCGKQRATWQVGACITTVRAFHKNGPVEDGSSMSRWGKDTHYAFHVLSSKVHGHHFQLMKAMQTAGNHGWVGVYQHICAACGGPPRLASSCWAHPVAIASGKPHDSLLHQSPRCIAHFLVTHSFETHPATTTHVKSSTDRYGACRCRLGELPKLPALWLTCRTCTNTEACMQAPIADHI